MCVLAHCSFIPSFRRKNTQRAKDIHFNSNHLFQWCHRRTNVSLILYELVCEWVSVCVCHSLSVVRTFFILFFGCHEMGHSIPIWFLFSSPDSNCSFFSLSYFVMDHFSTQFTANNNCTLLQAFEKKAKELEMKTKRHTITSRTAWKLHNSLGLCSVCVWFDINSTFVYVLWLCVWTEGMWL